MSNKITFVVVDGHTLGYIDPRQPVSCGVLHASIIRGASHDWRDGPLALPIDPEWVRSDACPKPLPLDGSVPVKLDPARVRPATLTDFDQFRVSPVGYLSDPMRYEMPAAV